MQEILNKIERIIEEELPSCCNADYMKDGCVYKMKNVIAKAKEVIRAEQKEPCKYCEEARYDELVFASNHENVETYCGVWIDHDKLHQKLVVEDYKEIENEIKINFCPMCGRPLNQPYTE